MSQVLGTLRRRGWRPSGKPARHAFESHSLYKTGSTLTSIDHQSSAPSIFDQGDLGSCYGHATARAVTTAMKLLGMPLPWVMSPDDHYRLTRCMMRAAGEFGVINTPLTDSGSDASKGMEALSIFGCRGMTRQSTPDGRFSDCADDTVNNEPNLTEVATDAHKVLLGDYGIASSGQQRIKDICTALSKTSVELGFYCDTGFENWQAGNPPYGAPNENDPNGGGHMVCIDGYTTNSDGSITFTIANSWSTEWGNNGRILVSEAFMLAPGVSDIFALLEVEAA